MESDLVGFSRNGTEDVKSLDLEMDYPKPASLIKFLIDRLTLSSTESFTVVDFFSGSATTAHALLNLNAEDGGDRKFILVQLPEICDEASESFKAGFKSIPEIGKERIRRAGEKLKQELKAKQADWKKKQANEEEKGSKLALEEDDVAEEPNPYVINPDSLDIGFKSFRIEDTKINWLKKDLRGEELDFTGISDKDALDFVPDFTDLDIVYELMLRQANIPLTDPITTLTEAGKRTYLYGISYVICLEEQISRELVETLAAQEPTPLKFFFRDSAFGKDIALKDETFRRLSAEIARHSDVEAAYTVEFI